jgi:hypothetical protein
LKILVLWILFLAGVVAIGLQFVAGAPSSTSHGAASGLDDDAIAISDRLRAHVLQLSHEIGDRGAHNAATLAEASDAIERELKHARLSPVELPLPAARGAMHNISAEIPGSRPGDVVILCAHYDSPPHSPGADADASGCAALLEIASRLSSRTFDRTLRFLFFAAGEGLASGTGAMGSRVAAKASQAAHERIVAVLSLDSLGYYSDADGSQTRPFPLTPCYPSHGDFLAFVSNIASRDLMQSCVADFGAASPLPTACVCLPGWIPGLSSGDQASYWNEGFKAVLVTDTGGLRNPNYQKMGDTFDRLDYSRLTRAVIGLTRVAESLASRTVPSS